MADFKIIKEHPWLTAGTVLIGGFLLYLLFRGRGSASAAPSGGVVTTTASDPTATAANAQLQGLQIQAGVQSQQIGASLQAIALQTDATLKGKAIDAATNLASISASQDVASQQIAAQLQLGLGTQSSTVQLAQIQAQAQQNVIDAITQAYGGTTGAKTATGTGTTSGTGVVSPTVINNNPGIMAPQQVTGVNGTVTNIPTVNTVTNTSYLPPGDGWLIAHPATPQYSTDPGYGAGCSPLDTACLDNNTTLANNFHLAVAVAQVDNNTAQCMLNAQNGRTPEEVASLQSQCTQAQQVNYSRIPT
jgi:hypothetical protein